MLTSVIQRLQLSRAKHPSLHGHARLSKRLARLVPFYEYGPDRFFAADGAPFEVAERRRAGFARLAHTLATRAPRTLAATAAAADGISDLQFTGRYRVPFQFRRLVSEQLKVGSFVESSDGVRVRDLDGNVAFDLTGSYGVNVFGYERLQALHRGRRGAGPRIWARCSAPTIRSSSTTPSGCGEISGLDEVSFHMSGTEAVMQAVRLARYHTGRSHLVQFAGAYHGWWDGVQAGRRQSASGARRLHAEGASTTRRCASCARGATSPACWSTRCRRSTRTPARRGDATLLASDRRAAFRS